MFPSRNATVLSASEILSGKALAFDGTDEGVLISDSPTFNNDDGTKSAYTFSCWFNPTNFSTQQPLAEKNGPSDFEWKITLSTQVGDEGEVYVAHTVQDYDEGGASSSQGTVLSGGVAAIAGEWNHVIVSFDGANSPADDGTPGIFVWLNGAKTFSNLGTNIETRMHNGTGDVRIGYSTYGTDQFMLGSIDEVIYINQHVCTDGQAAFLYNNGTPPDLTDFLSGKTKAYWRLGDGRDSISTSGIKDSAGNNHGTPQNMESADIVSR